MPRVRDTEDLLKSLYAYVMANLNTRITAINTEKDDFTIDTIVADDRHYIFAGEALDLPNGNFVQFAIDGEIETKINGNDIALIPTFMIEVAFDNPKAPNTYFKSLRYMRALCETVLNFESSVKEADGLEIANLVPMLVTLQGRQLVVSGVRMSVAIG